MTRVSAHLPNLINGVSQQAPAMRLPSQCAVMDNWYPSPVEGLCKRPPTEFVARLDAAVPDALLYHLIDRDEHERYHVLVTDGRLRVFTLEGREMEVAQAGDGYLTTAAPHRDLRLITSQDYTFVINRTVTVKAFSATFPAWRHEGIVFVRQGVAGAGYTVTINGVDTTYTLPSDSSSISTVTEQLAALLNRGNIPPFRVGWGTFSISDRPHRTGRGVSVTWTGAGGMLVAVDNCSIVNSSPFFGVSGLVIRAADARKPISIRINDIAVRGMEQEVYDALLNLSLAGNPGNIQARAQGAVVFLQSNQAFTLSARDNKGGSCITHFQRKAQNLSELPADAPDGYVIEIAGAADSRWDNYFVQFETDGGAPVGRGVWKECPQPGLTRGLDPETMPHALVRKEDGTFALQTLTWTERQAGDDQSAPLPSFVGHTINDLFFYRNRLGLLSNSNAILSQAADLFNFFPSSATTQLDSDPIDTAACHTKVNILRHAATLQEKLLFFADSTQYIMDDSMETFSPKTAAILPLMEYASSAACRPVGVGRSLFFTADRGENADLRELVLMDGYTPNDAPLMTSHVPRYIPSGVDMMVACATEELTLLHSPATPGTLYLYKSLWSGADKIQSSWGRWDFGGRAILGMGWVGNTCWFVFADLDGLSLEKLVLESDARDAGLEYKVHLDRRVTETQASAAYDAVTDETMFTLPYTLSETPELFLRVTGRDVAGTLLHPLRYQDNSVTVGGDWTREALYIGLPYTAVYRFSPPIASASRDGEKIVIGDSRLQIRSWLINFDRSGRFTVVVSPARRTHSGYSYTGAIIGSADSLIGTVPLESGQIRVPVLARNTQFTLDIITDSPLPCRIVSAEWVGELAQHSARL